MAGVARFELAMQDSKSRALTTWQYPYHSKGFQSLSTFFIITQRFFCADIFVKQQEKFTLMVFQLARPMLMAEQETRKFRGSYK